MRGKTMAQEVQLFQKENLGMVRILGDIEQLFKI